MNRRKRSERGEVGDGGNDGGAEMGKIKRKPFAGIGN